MTGAMRHCLTCSWTDDRMVDDLQDTGHWDKTRGGLGLKFSPGAGLRVAFYLIASWALHLLSYIYLSNFLDKLYF